MSGDRALTTSPLLFGYPGRDGRLAVFEGRGGRRFRLGGARAAEIVQAFVEPDDGAEFSPGELDEAVEAGLLVAADDDADVAVWERHGWSRAAFLLLSQMDTPFVESDGNGSVNERRRSTMERYLAEGGYSEPQPLADGEPLALPEPPPLERRLSHLTSRRSVRGFSDQPPDSRQLAGLLHGVTEPFRAAARDRARDDPLHLLNSFFSWAHLFVVAQDVDGVPTGVYEYDWREHRLLEAAPAPSDEALAACVQGQRWVLGTGFVVFLVADMRAYAWIYRQSRAYLHVLMQVGELGQELLMAASALGLGGCNTPAVHESRAAALLNLPDDDGVDPLAIVKLGRPRR